MTTLRLMQIYYQSSIGEVGKWSDPNSSGAKWQVHRNLPIILIPYYLGSFMCHGLLIHAYYIEVAVLTSKKGIQNPYLPFS